ncbi:phytanoyl-CoA dioxygenase family protein [Dactylosporangium sp. NPDC051485]|uniref:phytanoyl-CoA dioxygenase family protein n=1 Tax=Dactylosporangium sp. NPDC051485 TaxID=3154846 RepID=UPI00341318F6
MSRPPIDTLAPVLPPEDMLRSARDQLWSQGWTMLPDVLPGPLLDALTTECERLLATVQAGVGRQSATDNGGGVLVMNGLDARSELLFDLARTDELRGMAEFLLDKAAMPIHTEYFGKPRASAEPTPPHQDQVFYQDHFADEPAITFWCPLQEVTTGQGTLEYGSPAPAQGSLLPHRQSATVDFGAELVDPFAYTFVPAPVPVGGCLVHNSYVVHRSGPMTDDRPRRVFAFNYRGSSFRERLRRSGLRP